MTYGGFTWTYMGIGVIPGITKWVAIVPGVAVLSMLLLPHGYGVDIAVFRWDSEELLASISVDHCPDSSLPPTAPGG